MIRALLMITAAGFVLCVGCLAAAVAIGGPEALSQGLWRFSASDGGWGWGWRSRYGHGDDHGTWRTRGPQSSRTLAWSGGDRLAVDLPADISYVQADGPGSVTLSGPQNIVDHVVVQDGEVRMEGFGPHWWPEKVKVIVRAPGVKRFDLSGANALSIEGFNQDKLSLDVSGAAEVSAKGQADSVDLQISGTGDVDLGGLKTKGAQVRISGAGGATIAPTDWADLDISGMGDIRMLTRPPKLDTHISGAGRIRQAAGDQPSASSGPASSQSAGDKT